jgi:hypothetical protein
MVFRVRDHDFDRLVQAIVEITTTMQAVTITIMVVDAVRQHHTTIMDTMDTVAVAAVMSTLPAIEPTWHNSRHNHSSRRLQLTCMVSNSKDSRLSILSKEFAPTN